MNGRGSEWLEYEIAQVKSAFSGPRSYVDEFGAPVSEDQLAYIMGDDSVYDEEEAA